MRAGTSTLAAAAVLAGAGDSPPRLSGTDFGTLAELSLGPSSVSDDDDTAAATTTSSRKGANMTEKVPVPSSEHVAEIVGRQGCKIKALRNKTNTYIKTPVRGEEPVFVVTGRQQDVDSARCEILSAAEHFTQIRASRRHHPKGSSAAPAAPPRRRSPSPGPGPAVQGNRRPGRGTATTTLGVRVPMSMVGLVVGPKGATIKRIQADTGTYIVTPGRDRDPVFEVIGSPDAVERAKQHIDAYIETRLAATAAADSRPSRVGEGWCGDADGLTTGRLDLLVDSHDALSRLLALNNADYSRPPPHTPAAWPVVQPTPPTWSSWSAGTLDPEEDTSRLSSFSGLYNTSPLTHSRLSVTTDPEELISALYARMLIAADTAAAAHPSTPSALPDQILSGDPGALSTAASAPLGAFQTSLGVDGVLSDLYREDPSSSDCCWNSAFLHHDDVDLSHSAEDLLHGPGGLAGARPWRLRSSEVGVTTALGGAGRCGSDGAATSPSCSPAESSAGSAA